MKKALAILLALTMVLGMGTVAFAASYSKDIAVHDEAVMTYNSRSKTMSEVTSGEFTPGKTYYYWVENLDGDYNSGKHNIKSTSGLEKYRLSYSIEDGKKALDSVKFVIKDVDHFPAALSGAPETGKNAFIAITFKDNYSSEETDVDITVKVTGRGSSYEISGTEEINFVETLVYEEDLPGSPYISISDSKPLVDFSDLDEDNTDVELYFGDDGEVEFHVDVKGQKTLFLKYSDDATGTSYEVDEKYPDASLEYHLFIGSNKTFKRTGELIIPADILSNGKAPYLYEISSSGKLTQVNASYDKNDEKFTVKTKTLGNYVVSDIKLSASSASKSSEDEEEESSSSKTSSSSKPSSSSSNSDYIYSGHDNPETGVKDFVGVAAALAVVSVAAIGVTSIRRKK